MQARHARDREEASRAVRWVGARADDVHGRRAGTVAGVVVDREDGRPLWLLVALASGGRHVLVPIDGTLAGAGRVLLPHDRRLLQSLPGVPADGAVAARTERLATEAFGRPSLPARAAWDRRRVTALARIDAFGELTWDPGPRGPQRHEPLRRAGVLVVEDGPRVSRVLAVALDGHPALALVGVAHPPGHAAALTRQDVAVVVVDLDIGDEDGLRVLREVRTHASAPLLVLVETGGAALSWPPGRGPLVGRHQPLDVLVGAIALRARIPVPG